MCDDDICTCGHARSEHYEYILNGKPQGRCRGCDPWVGNKETNIMIESGSPIDIQDQKADHWFTENSN